MRQRRASTRAERTSPCVASRRVEHAAHAVGIAHEAGDERIARLLVELARRAFLRDHGPVHHDDAVGDGHRLRLVVRHVDDGEARAAAAARGSPRASGGAAARRGSTAARRTAAPTGSSTSARATATRCCWPPESSEGRRASRPVRPTVASAARARSSAARFGMPRHDEPVAHVLEHAHVREQRVALEHHRHVALGGGARVTSSPPIADRARRSAARGRRCIRRIVVLPQPDGPSSVTSVPARDRRTRRRARRRRRRSAWSTFAEFDRRGFHAVRLPLHRRRCRRARRSARGRRAALRRPEPALADEPLDEPDHRQHQHDQHGAVGDRDAVVAVDDAIDDVRRRPFVFGGDEEDHRGHRRHRRARSCRRARRRSRA